MREQRLKDTLAGMYKFGAYLDKIDDINDKGCRMEMGAGRGACRLANEMTKKFVFSKFVEDVLSRIDESWQSKNRKGQPGFTDEEFEMAFELAFEGKKVVARGSDTGAPGAKGNKSFDAWVDGERWEFKDLPTTSRKGIAREIYSADEQGADVAFVRLPNVDEKMARSALNSVIRSQQKSNDLTAVRMQGDGYDFIECLR